MSVDNKSNGSVPWLLGGSVSLVVFVAWAAGLDWRLSTVTILSLFPLLGLLAWGLMWTHYSVGLLVSSFPSLKGSASYRNASRYAVLGLILLHPGLLIWNQWKVNDVLPPGSIYSYVASSLKGYVFFGSLSLLILLSFEIFDRYRNSPTVRSKWFFVSLAQMFAMTLLFAHAIALGGTLQQDWFLFFWVCLGVTLIPAFYVVGASDWYYSRSKSDVQGN